MEKVKWFLVVAGDIVESRVASALSEAAASGQLEPIIWKD